MRTQVQKWGNSLALRIPRTFAVESNLQAGSEVDLSIVKGRLIVAPISKPDYSLEELLDGVTKHNIHSEVDAGPPQGREAL
jgi:antitoxin MazE